MQKKISFSELFEVKKFSFGKIRKSVFAVLVLLSVFNFLSSFKILVVYFFRKVL